MPTVRSFDFRSSPSGRSHRHPFLSAYATSSGEFRGAGLTAFDSARHENHSVPTLTGGFGRRLAAPLHLAPTQNAEPVFGKRNSTLKHISVSELSPNVTLRVPGFSKVHSVAIVSPGLN